MKFDLEKALKDGRAITRDGREVTQLVRFEVDNKYTLRGVVDGKIFSWIEYGYAYDCSNKSPLDLQNAPEKLSGFVNVYKSGSAGKIHRTKEKAQECGSGRIACIDLSQFNVGHGLEE